MAKDIGKILKKVRRIINFFNILLETVNDIVQFYLVLEI